MLAYMVVNYHPSCGNQWLLLQNVSPRSKNFKMQHQKLAKTHKSAFSNPNLCAIQASVSRCHVCSSHAETLSEHRTLQDLAFLKLLELDTLLARLKRCPFRALHPCRGGILHGLALVVFKVGPYLTAQKQKNRKSLNPEGVI